jgi:hypothetical protein
MVRLMPIAVIAAIAASLALPALASAGGLSSLIEFGSELLDGVGTKIPDSLIAPSDASDSFLSSSVVDSAIDGDSALSAAERRVNEDVGSTAEQFGTNVATLTHASEQATAAEVMRDCVKEAASDAAWDVWWGYYNQESVDVSLVLTNVTAGCLHTYTQAPWPQSEALAQTLTYYIDQSAGAVIRYQADAATVSNWLQAVSDSIPS